MGKKSKSKSESNTSKEEVEENTNPNDSSDIFRLLFGRETHQEPGLGLRGLGDDTELQPEANNDDSSKKKKKKKREKLLNSDSPELIVDESPEKKNNKRKSKKEAEPIDESDENLEKKKKKKLKNSVGNDKNTGEIVPAVVEKVEDLNEKSNNKNKKKKKRKRDEIEEAYEAKTYGVVATVEGKQDGDNKNHKVGQKRKTLVDPAAMKVSKDEFDDESKLLRTIFVGNLPLKFKKKLLLKEFTKFGEIESVRIRSVPIVDSKTPRKGAIMKGQINEAVDSVHAYIVFKDEKSAQAALSHNMAVVGGNHIRVDKACPPRKKLKGDSSPVYDNQRTVFVGNLPFDVKDEELYQLFCGIKQLESSVEAVRVIRDPNSSLGKGIAYVLFKTKEAANLVVRKRNLMIRDRDLRLYHAKADSTPSKKRSLPTTPTGNSSGKRLAITSSGNKPQSKTALSYQGLKASKSIQKEGKKRDDFRPRSGGQGKRTPSTPTRAEVKQTKNKRPAVAARKAKALKSAEASKQVGLKRKPERHTPDKFRPKKKFRK